MQAAATCGPGGAGGKPSARGAVGLGFDSRRLPSLGLSAPPASTSSGDGLPRSRSLEEEEKEPSCKWAVNNPLEGRINKKSMYSMVVQQKNPIVVLLLFYLVNNCEKKSSLMFFSYLFLLFFIISLININPRRPVLGTERAGPVEGGVNTPRVSRLLGHVATRGKLHSEENQE